MAAATTAALDFATAFAAFADEYQRQAIAAEAEARAEPEAEAEP